jgi:monofunctional biosynthetic peptidoglycan transglycosylase
VKLARGWLARAGLALLLVAVVFVGLALVRVVPIVVSGLSRRAPERSALMKQREREARQKGRAYHESHQWVSLDRISPHLRDAVLVAEDARFFSHEGFDWNEIRESAKRNLRAKRVVRGGSTITQQLAKNLWLSTAQTPWRKFEEMILAVRLEHALSKRRILELYLNTIEWGEGVYGAEAAARHWFGVSAASLDASQAIRLAAVIINPRRFSPVDPNPRIERRIRTIASRLRRRGAISELEYRLALGLPPEEAAPAVDSSFLVAPDTTAPPPPFEPVPSPEPVPDAPPPGPEPPLADSFAVSPERGGR